MFTRFVNKFSAVILSVSVVAGLSLTGCGSLEESNLSNVENNSFSNDSSANINADNNLENSSSDNVNRSDTTSNDKELQEGRDYKKTAEHYFKNVSPPPRASIPLQKDASGKYKEGVFFSPHLIGPEIDRNNNVWLIQLPSDQGHRVEVEAVHQVGDEYTIYVNTRYDYDPQYNGLPTFGFFQIGKKDMPGNAKVRVFDIDKPGHDGRDNSTPIYQGYASEIRFQ